MNDGSEIERINNDCQGGHPLGSDRLLPQKMYNQ